MPGPQITKAGSTEIKKVGHTTGTKHGANALATRRGESEPTPISFSGNK